METVLPKNDKKFGSEVERTTKNNTKNVEPSNSPAELKNWWEVFIASAISGAGTGALIAGAAYLLFGIYIDKYKENMRTVSIITSPVISAGENKNQEIKLSAEAKILLQHIFNDQVALVNLNLTRIGTAVNMSKNSVLHHFEVFQAAGFLDKVVDEASRAAGYSSSLTTGYKLTKKGRAYVVNNGLLTR